MSRSRDVKLLANAFKDFGECDSDIAFCILWQQEKTIAVTHIVDEAGEFPELPAIAR